MAAASGLLPAGKTPHDIRDSVEHPLVAQWIRCLYLDQGLIAFAREIGFGELEQTDLLAIIDYPDSSLFTEDVEFRHIFGGSQAGPFDKSDDATIELDHAYTAGVVYAMNFSYLSAGVVSNNPIRIAGVKTHHVDQVAGARMQGRRAIARDRLQAPDTSVPDQVMDIKILAVPAFDEIDCENNAAFFADANHVLGLTDIERQRLFAEDCFDTSVCTCHDDVMVRRNGCAYANDVERLCGEHFTVVGVISWHRIQVLHGLADILIAAADCPDLGSCGARIGTEM